MKDQDFFKLTIGQKVWDRRTGEDDFVDVEDKL
jgi:hypothetical protein